MQFLLYYFITFLLLFLFFFKFAEERFFIKYIITKKFI